MIEKKKFVAKKPVPKKKPKQMSSEEYNTYLERETINIIKLRQFYSEVEEFERRYYHSCQGNLRQKYPRFEDFKYFLEQQMEEHLKNLEKIVKQKYHGFP
jgi:hypothetical protein